MRKDLSEQLEQMENLWENSSNSENYDSFNNAALQLLYKIDLFKLGGSAFVELAEDSLESDSSSFRNLCEYIEKKYPEFEISDFPDIQSLQEKGNPLHFAIQKKDPVLLDLLIKSNAGLDQKDDYGHSALDLLLARKHMRFRMSLPYTTTEKKMISLLLNKTSELLSTTNIQFLISNLRHEDRLQLLVIIKNNVKKEDLGLVAHEILKNDDLPLMFIEDLIEEGLPVDTTDGAGRSLLYAAIENVEEDLVELLMKKGADPQLKRSTETAGALTPLELANAKNEQYTRLLSKKISVPDEFEMQTEQEKKC